MQLPESTTHKFIVLLKDNQPVESSQHIKVSKTSPTTIEVQIVKAKPADEGKYSVVVDEKPQPVMQ